MHEKYPAQDRTLPLAIHGNHALPVSS